MNILVINAGSSSLKCAYFSDHSAIATVHIERIGEERSRLSFHSSACNIERTSSVKDHQAALEAMQSLFDEAGERHLLDALDAVGHRVVHGGERFCTPTRITPESVLHIRALSQLAPLHNPANLEGIKVLHRAYANIPHIAVFDTAFHTTLPPHARTYAIDSAVAKRYHIHRYGFHGTSHSFVAKEAAKRLGKPLESLNLITLHLGNGASACAVQEGKSIDTSMGFTPLEGLVMGTRSGDLDPAILPYLEQNGYDTKSIDKLLNKESGLLGICGTNDMREVIALAEQGNPDATLALEIFCYRIRKYIGAYAVALGSLDAIVFTGGIGEHATKVRQMVCEKLGILGVKYDDAKNEAIKAEGGRFHQDESNVALLVVPTDEELEIALQCEEMLTSS